MFEWLLIRDPLQFIYHEFHSTAKSPKLFLSAIILLREVNNAGYVHGDKKAANFLGRSWFQTSKVSRA